MTDTLPTLDGTAKQIAWARSIRETALDTLREARDHGVAELEAAADAGQAPTEAVDAAREAYDAFERELLDRTDAGWWIDRQHYVEPRRVASDAADRARAAIAPHLS